MTDGRIQYARNGSTRLAYRVFGDGDASLLFTPGWINNLGWYDDPATPLSNFAALLSRELRLVVWDKRGSGLSDPVTHAQSAEERVDDLLAIADAAELDRPNLFGSVDGGSVSVLFAATHPKRVRSLVLYATAAWFTQDPPGYPWEFTQAEVEATLEVDEILGFVRGSGAGRRPNACSRPFSSPTSSVLPSCSHGLSFENLGAHRLKGLPDETTIYRVRNGR